MAVRSNGVLTWVLSDHLGSSTVTADESGVKLNETRYTAFGEVRPGFSSLGTSYEYTGQLSQMEEIGLYYYVARWYDPVTAHFSQADSLIPSPSNMLSWNRYSYAYYNSVRYADPTGHRVCETNGNDGVCVKTGIPGSLGQIKVTLRTYGVSLVSSKQTQWKFDDAYEAYLGVYDLASSMARVAKQEATETFKQALGPMTFNLRNDISYFAIASDGNIDFQMGRITRRLTTHELGHSFERHMWTNAGGVYKANNPVQMLIDSGVSDINGNLITKGGNRYNGLDAPENGYRCDSYVGECQYHSKDVDTYWNDSSEDFSDMLMNWTYKSFANNQAGDALYNWIETNMVEWVNSN